MTLRELHPGESGTILGFEPSAAINRLMEMGMVPGSQVQVVRVAPFGDPIDLKVRDYHLSIRKSEAALIHISRHKG